MTVIGNREQRKAPFLLTSPRLKGRVSQFFSYFSSIGPVGVCRGEGLKSGILASGAVGNVSVVLAFI